MAIFRCAACGSQNVSTDTQSAGIKYDYVKGAVGTVLLGAGGAAAGITNKEQRVFKCADCGLTLSYPMAEDMKRMIDEGVEFANRRDHLYLKGVLMPWDFIKSQYKNIESGNADKELEEKANKEKNRAIEGIEILKTRGTASEDEFERSISNIHRLFCRFDPDEYLFDKSAKDFGETLFSSKKLPSITDYLSFISSLDVFFSNYFRFRPYELPKEKHIKNIFCYLLPVYIAADFYSSTGTCISFEEWGSFTGGDIEKELYEKYHFHGYYNLSDKKFKNFIIANPFYCELLLFAFESSELVGNISQLKEALYQKSFEKKSGAMLDFYSYFGVFSGKCLFFNAGNTIYPKYKIENGSLYYNNLAFVYENGDYDTSVLSNEYFTYFPDKKKEYDIAIAEHKKKAEDERKEKEGIERKKSELNGSIAELEKQLLEYNNEIEHLRKKVFGKTKAEAKIQELEPMIQKHQATLKKAKDEQSFFNNYIAPESECDIEFYSKLEKQFDYYLVWHRIDEVGLNK